MKNYFMSNIYGIEGLLTYIPFNGYLKVIMIYSVSVTKNYIQPTRASNLKLQKCSKCLKGRTNGRL